MNSPSEPRLNKLPFFLTDAACLLAAGLIGYFSKDPFAPLPLVCIALLVIAGGSALLFPYLTDYAADSSEASARLRDEIELQIKRAQAAGESLTRAAAQIKAIEEAVHKSARDAETLPYRMQEKLAEFNEALAAKENDDREALEQELEELRAANSTQLKAVAEKNRQGRHRLGRPGGRHPPAAHRRGGRPGQASHRHPRRARRRRRQHR